MATGIGNIVFECKRCGGTVLNVPENPSDDTLVSCQGCGVVVDAWGDLRRRAAKPGKDDMMKVANKALAGMKNWKKL